MEGLFKNKFAPQGEAVKSIRSRSKYGWVITIDVRLGEWTPETLGGSVVYYNAAEFRSL